MTKLHLIARTWIHGLLPSLFAGTLLLASIACNHASSTGGNPPGSAGTSARTGGAVGGTNGGQTSGGATSAAGGGAAGQGGSSGGATGKGGAAGQGGSSGGTTGQGGSGGDAAGKGGATGQGGASGGATGQGGSSGGATGQGGSGGGGAGTGGAVGQGGGGAITPGPNGEGIIRITDPVPGWASQEGGTTGGGTDLSAAVTVTTMSDLQKHVSGTDPKIILVEPGEYKGALLIGANKTIIGTRRGVVIKGYIQMRADAVDNGGSNKETHNIIIRNLAVQGDPCSDLTACREGPDAIYMGGGAHHIWLDHLDVYDGQDGNCDATRASDFMTVSWSQFRYTYEKPHRFSNLIAGADDETESKGKLKMTYMNCWWGERVEQRQPRGRFGDVHCFNNLHNSKLNPDGKQYAIGPGLDMSIIVENCVFDMEAKSKAIKTKSYTTVGPFRGVLSRGNIGHTKGTDEDCMNCELGSSHFTIPYKYNLIPAEKVEETLTKAVGGAGNTCVFAK